MGTLDRSIERSRASPRSGRSKGPADATRPRGGVTRKSEPSGPGYAGHIQGMCRRPLCPFLRCMKFLLMQRLTCPICRFSGFIGGEMNFHKCGWNCRVFCGNNSTLWISPPFGRLASRVNFHIVWSAVTRDGKLRVWTGGGFWHVSFDIVIPFSAVADGHFFIQLPPGRGPS